MAEDHVEEKPKPKRRKRVLVDVAVVAQEGKSALVQYIDPETEGIARGFVSPDAIENGKCDVVALEAAQRYGVPWGELVAELLEKLNVCPQRVEDVLHGHGIWTVEDLEQNTARSQRAISSMTAPIVPMLHGMGKKYEKG